MNPNKALLLVLLRLLIRLGVYLHTVLSVIDIFSLSIITITYLFSVLAFYSYMSYNDLPLKGAQCLRVSNIKKCRTVQWLIVLLNILFTLIEMLGYAPHIDWHSGVILFFTEVFVVFPDFVLDILEKFFK